MRITIFFIALAVAGLLEREGYQSFAWGLILIAFVEAIVIPWWRTWKIKRRLRQLQARIVNGQTQAGLEQMKPGLSRLFSMWRFGSEKPEKVLTAETARAIGLELTVAEATLLMAVLKGELTERYAAPNVNDTR